MTPNTHVLEVWGDLACFSRPDFGKVERFSYPVITPSAARGIFDAICVNRHEYRWQITKIEVLEPPRYIALRRNEVKNRAPAADTILAWAAGNTPPKPIWADGDKAMLGTDQEGRTQRQTMALKRPHYRLHAQIRPWPGFEDKLKGMEAKFVRRARAGQCFCQPCFGCREFPAYFRLVEEEEPEPHARPYGQDLGWMLYDVFDLSRPGEDTDPAFITVFNATVVGGVLAVPDFDATDVRKPTMGAGHD